MRIALVGGTHGNEPVGIEVMRLIEESRKSYVNEHECFWGNPKAYDLKKRYVDCDLNRTVGAHGRREGYEKQRVAELESKISGDFDFLIDLHTTTTNMGLTVVLTNTHIASQKAAAFLKSQIPDLKIIEEDRLDDDSPHLNRLCSAGVIIEVGPVANNVVSGDLVLKTHWMVEALLNFDFTSEISLQNVEVFKQYRVQNYPEASGWYIHPNLENQDFQPIQKGTPCFINIEGEEILFDEEGPCYPFFINEAAYLENASAFLLSKKVSGFTKAKS